MLGQRSGRWQTCGATSIGARGCAPTQRAVVSRAFKKNRSGNRPGFADPPSNPGYNLPPLNAPGYGTPQQQQQQAAPPQQQQQQHQQQQQQQQRMPPPQQPGWGASPAGQPGGAGQQAPPPPAQPAVQTPPPAQPGFNGQQQQQPGFVNSPPPAAPMAAPPQQAPAQNPVQPGFQQQPGFVQNPAQGYPQQGGQQQQGGYNAGGWQQQAPPQQQQGGYQQQQAWSDVGSFTDADMGGYIDSTGKINPNDAGGYINPPQQRNGWSQQGGNQTQGYYRNNRQQQQNQYLDGGYMNDQGGGGWNQGGQQRGNRPGFAGFENGPAAAWTEDFLLRQLDASMTQRNLMPDWSEVVEQEVVEDLTPKYVNGKRVLVNSEIDAPQVRVQDGSKGDLGVMTFEQAREASFAQDVDVVMITADADPPVVRLISFSKYKYELEKSAKQKQKASKGPEIKEVKLRPVTEKADYETKVKQAQKFLSKGAKVKLTMTFSGREMRFKDQGKEMMLKLIEELSETAKMEAPLALRPSNFSVTLAPLK